MEIAHCSCFRSTVTVYKSLRAPEGTSLALVRNRRVKHGAGACNKHHTRPVCGPCAERPHTSTGKHKQKAPDAALSLSAALAESFGMLRCIDHAGRTCESDPRIFSLRAGDACCAGAAVRFRRLTLRASRPWLVICCGVTGDTTRCRMITNVNTPAPRDTPFGQHHSRWVKRVGAIMRVSPSQPFLSFKLRRSLSTPVEQL